MRENLGRLWWHRAILLPLFLCGAAWADNYRLESVDFASNGEKTNIIFHTDSILPVHKVHVSNNKLILDIDQIQTDGTVKTNFLRAANISHVIMQPLGEHKLRMIIRGENLGKPAIAFFNATMGAYSLPNPNAQVATKQDAISNPQEASQEALTVSDDTHSETAVDPAISSSNTPTAEPQLSADDSVLELPPIEESIQPAPTAKTPTEILAAPLSLPEATTNIAAHETLPFPTLKLPRSWETYIPYGLLGLVLLGVVGFIAHRVIRLRQAEKPLEDLLADKNIEESTGKRRGFREMADAYRNKQSKQYKNPPKKPQATDLIGLRSLKKMESVEPVRSFEQPTEAQRPMPTQPLKAAPPKQALNQYLKAQPQARAAKPASKPTASDREYQEALRRELKRAQDAKEQVKKQLQPNKLLQQQRMPTTGTSAPVNRALAARKAAPASRPTLQNKAQGPLPGNPEVLNFLRNVADLMEKDGKTDIAKSIHKNLNAQKLGLS
jgi:hypothetical protein